MTRIFRSFGHVLVGTPNPVLVAIGGADGGADTDATGAEAEASGALDADARGSEDERTVGSCAGAIIGLADGSGAGAAELAVAVGGDVAGVFGCEGVDPDDFTIRIVPSAVTPRKIDAPMTISVADRRGADGTSAA